MSNITKQQARDGLYQAQRRFESIKIEIRPLWDAYQRMKVQITRTFPTTAAHPECRFDRICPAAYTRDNAQERFSLFPQMDRISEKLGPLKRVKEEIEREVKSWEDILEDLDPEYKAMRMRARKVAREVRRTWD